MRSQHDEDIARYLALRPWEYYDLERLELAPPLAYLGSGTGRSTVLRLALRAPTHGERLFLAFYGVHELRFEMHGSFTFHLTITSIRDRQWERLKYLMHEEEQDTLRFYCERFEAMTQAVDDFRFESPT